MNTKRKSALIAGIALLIMAIAAAFTYGYIHHTLVVSGDLETTVRNLSNNRMLFHTEIFGWIFILILDVIVAWALYRFFKTENRKLSLLTAGLRIVFVIIFGIAISELFNVLIIFNENVATTQQLGKQIMNHLLLFESTWSFGLIIFGFHLLFLGILALKSKSIHVFWGILLIFSAVSYSIIHSAKILLPEFEHQIAMTEMILSLPMAFGEVGFAFWLIIRGGKPKTIYKSINKVSIQS